LKRLVVSLPPGLATGPAGRRVGGGNHHHADEIRGLMEGRLYVDAPPLGATKLTDWIARHRDTLGRHYTSEMARRLDRISEYRSN